MSATIFGSLDHYLLCCLVVFAAQVVYLLFGFGSGLISVGLMALILPDVKDVVIVLLGLGFPAEVYVAATNSRKINWRRVLLILAGIFAGIPAGATLLERYHPTILLPILGATLLLFGGAMLAFSSLRSVRWPRFAPPFVGVLSGLLAGLFGTGGPPLIFYYHLGGEPKTAFRSNLMGIFCLTSLLRIPTYLLTGLLTLRRFEGTLLLFPAAAAGALLGDRLHLELPEATFRRLVSIAIALIGLLLLLRG